MRRIAAAIIILFAGTAAFGSPPEQLSEKPFTATAELNEWRQPGPGHYRLYVLSYRVWRSPDPNEATPYGRVAVMLRSSMPECCYESHFFRASTAASRNAACSGSNAGCDIFSTAGVAFSGTPLPNGGCGSYSSARVRNRA